MPAVRRRLEQTLVPAQPWRHRRLPSLMEELIEEILLRLRPDEPASLVRAALVCKPWRRLISSPRFQRRFHELHRTLPILGFICNHLQRPSSFVRTSTSSPLPLQRDTSRLWCALDARHGRVLLRLGERLRVPVRVLVVWDPITDDQQELPVLPRPTIDCTAAVLCDATGTCDHRGCHSGPFKVVFVGTERGNMFVCTYSSDVAVWSAPISIEHLGYKYQISGGYSPTVLLGNQLYFGIPTTNAALKYDLELQDMSWIQLPSLEYGLQTSVLTITDDGKLGLVRLLDGMLCVWLRMDTPEGNAGWKKLKVIDLRRRLHVRPKLVPKACVVGFADGLGIVFVTVNRELYTVDLETCKVKKQACIVKQQVYSSGEIETVFPYMHFYSPRIMTVGS